MKEMVALQSKRRVDIWNISPVLIPAQTFSVHIVHFLRECIQGYEVV